jgi:hypothetical protein
MGDIFKKQVQKAGDLISVEPLVTWHECVGEKIRSKPLTEIAREIQSSSKMHSHMLGS